MSTEAEPAPRIAARLAALAVGTLLAVLVLLARELGNADEYAPDRISVDGDSVTYETRRIYFEVVGEDPGYRCVGANLTRIGNDDVLTFVRAADDETVEVDLPVRHSSKGVVGPYVEWSLSEDLVENGGETRLAIAGRGVTRWQSGVATLPARR